MPKLELYGKRDKAAWRDMQRALGLLLLSVEGTLAQSRAASQWDGNVPGYGGTVDGCPCTADCSPNSLEEVVQVSSNSVTATFVSGADLKFAYLTDEHGTIISYKAGDDLDFGPTGSSSITFEWSASEQPTGVVPHIVYADSCADAVYRNPDGTTVTSTWVRQGPHPRHATTCTHTVLGPRPARVPCASPQPRATPLNVVARAIAAQQAGAPGTDIRRTTLVSNKQAPSLAARCIYALTPHTRPPPPSARPPNPTISSSSSSSALPLLLVLLSLLLLYARQWPLLHPLPEAPRPCRPHSPHHPTPQPPHP